MTENISPRQFFHVTTQEAVPSIREHGIDNTRSTDELWSNTDDWDDGAYLWDSPGKALTYARDFRKMGRKPAVVGVNPEGLDLAPDETGVQAVEGAYHTRSVPPQNVRLPKRYR